MSGKNIGLIVLVVAVVGGGIWWASAGPDQVATNQSTSSEAELAAAEQERAVNTQSSESAASIRELIARGEALKCTFSFADEEGATGEGTGYFASDERMRMEYTTTQNGEVYSADYITTDGAVYIWGEMEQGDFGIKMSFAVDSDAGAEVTQREEQLPLEMDEDIAFNCSSWSVDEAVFSLPADVEFMDMNAMMQGMLGGQEMTPEQLEAMQAQFGN